MYDVKTFICLGGRGGGRGTPRGGRGGTPRGGRGGRGSFGTGANKIDVSAGSNKKKTFGDSD